MTASKPSYVWREGRMVNIGALGSGKAPVTK